MVGLLEVMVRILGMWSSQFFHDFRAKTVAFGRQVLLPSTTILFTDVVMLCAAMQVPAQQMTQTILSEQIELARLVDLCAQRLDLNIQYDQASLRGTMTLRLGAGVTDDKL